MAAFSTMALIGASLLGTAAAANSQRKQRREQERRMREQEAAVREKSRLGATRDETGAEVELGREGQAGSGGVAEVITTPGTDTTGAVAGRVGGVRRKRKGGASASLGL